MQVFVSRDKHWDAKNKIQPQPYMKSKVATQILYVSVHIILIYPPYIIARRVKIIT